MAQVFAITCCECASQVGYSITPPDSNAQVYCYQCMQNLCMVATVLDTPNVPGVPEFNMCVMQTAPRAWHNQKQWNETIHQWKRDNAKFAVYMRGGLL